MKRRKKKKKKKRNRNLIYKILLDDGQWIHSRAQIEGYFTSNFCEVYQSSHPQISSELEDLVVPSITEGENLELSRVLEPEEIRGIVWEMNPWKAPSPDGLPGLFLKRYWPTVGAQVTAAVQSFFRDGYMLKKMN